MESLKEISNAIKEIEQKITDQEYLHLQDLLKKIYDNKICVYEVKYVECLDIINVDAEDMYTNSFKKQKTVYMKFDSECRGCFSCFNKGEITQCMLKRYEKDGYLIINDSSTEINSHVGFLKTFFVTSMKKIN